MSPENDRDSQCFKLPDFGTCLYSTGSLIKPYFRMHCVGVAESDVMGYV